MSGALSADQERELKVVVDQWVEWNPNADDKKAVAAAYASTDGKVRTALYDSFFPRINFGTAGLRARMEAGYGRMNELVIVQTTQGLCRYIEQQIGAERAKQMGVVIGYDGRHRSKRFAEITAGTGAAQLVGGSSLLSTPRDRLCLCLYLCLCRCVCAAVLLSQGHRVYLFGVLAMTPIVPFTVSTLKCAAGVMVTASHNPKQDNGYKVYWSNGAQIVPPHDAGIAQAIAQNLKPWTLANANGRVGAYECDRKSALISDPTADMTARYMSESAKRYSWFAANSAAKLKVAYTAMHGVGHAWIRQAFSAFGLHPFVPVTKQVEPDPEFPTVAFPNPEEGKGALALSIATADANGCPLIIANDPDADRLAVAEKDAK
jgi:phosphoglucomutase / phosphopentomutase